MDVLIELILDNIIFLFVIIAGLVSFFNRMMSAGKDNQEQQSSGERSRRQGEGAGRQTVREVMRRMQEVAESLEQDTDTGSPQRRTSDQQGRTNTTPIPTTTSDSPTYSFEQQRDEQYRRLQKQYESVASTDEIETAIDPDSPIYTHVARTESEANVKTRQTKTSVDLKSRLNADGLIESVIMAEVLGPPRARKRYSNRYLER